MLTPWNYEDILFTFAVCTIALWAIGLGILKPNSGLKALPARNRLGFVFILLGILLACLTALMVTIYQLLPLLVPT